MFKQSTKAPGGDIKDIWWDTFTYRELDLPPFGPEQKQWLENQLKSYASVEWRVEGIKITAEEPRQLLKAFVMVGRAPAVSPKLLMSRYYLQQSVNDQFAAIQYAASQPPNASLRWINSKFLKQENQSKFAYLERVYTFYKRNTLPEQSGSIDNLCVSYAQLLQLESIEYEFRLVSFKKMSSDNYYLYLVAQDDDGQDVHLHTDLQVPFNDDLKELYPDHEIINL